MSESRYRWPTIGVTGACLVLSGFCVWWQFIVYVDYRSPDFTAVSKGPILETCVEAVTNDQLKTAWYDKTDWKCNDDSKKDLSNLLMASVHAMYSSKLLYTSGDAKAVYDAVIMATQGEASGYSITRAAAYAALSIVGTPSTTDCSALYGGLTAEGAAPAPLEPTVVCDADVPASNPAPTATEDTAKLYTHCMHQFSYARSYPTQGTFGIPKVGVEASPRLIPIIGTNSTTPWYDRARIVVGTRWGYANVVYVVFALATAFFLMDCTVLLLAELTRIDSYFAQNAITEGGVMTMLATFQAKRNLRWAVAIVLILLEIVLWVLLIGLPWGFGMNFARPVCETGESSHWIAPFHSTTMAGWKLDYDAFSLEILILASHLLVAIAVPISNLAKRGGGEQGRRERTGQGELEGFTGVAVGSLRSAWWFTILSVGALVFYIGQAVAAFRFGVAWAHGVSFKEFNEIALGAMLYDSVNAILYMSLTIGLALGSIVGRWMLAGLSCTSFTIFLIWVFLTVGAFIPPFFVSSYWLFFSFEDSQNQKDCKSTFGDSDDYLFARTACDVRAGTYIAGILLILVAALGPVIIGLIDFSRVACLPRRRAWVDMPDYWRKLVEPANPKFRTFAPAGGDPAIVPLTMKPVHQTGTGFRSGHTGFFNFDTRLTVLADHVAPLGKL